MNESEWIRYRRLRFARILLDNAANDASRALALRMLESWNVTILDVERATICDVDALGAPSRKMRRESGRCDGT